MDCPERPDFSIAVVGSGVDERQKLGASSRLTFRVRNDSYLGIGSQKPAGLKSAQFRSLGLHLNHRPLWVARTPPRTCAYGSFAPGQLAEMNVSFLLSRR